MRRAAVVLTAGLGAMLIAQYLAGYLFLWWFKLPPHAATPLTVTRYLHFYGDNADVLRRAGICSALGLALVSLGAGAALRRAFAVCQRQRRLCALDVAAGAALSPARVDGDERR